MKGAIEMDEKLLKLRQQLHAKTMEIEAFVAKQEGMSDLKEMDPAVYHASEVTWRNFLRSGRKRYTKGH